MAASDISCVSANGYSFENCVDDIYLACVKRETIIHLWQAHETPPRSNSLWHTEGEQKTTSSVRPIWASVC